MKKIAIIPTLLTLGNAVSGFAAVAMAGKMDNNQEPRIFFAYAGWLIIAAMLFDALDGYVARLSRSVSRFGAELDSLCDAVSFGVAPAFLLIRMGPGWQPRPLFHQVLACIAALYLVCAILRLARFNVENSPDLAGAKRFRGLPSPGAAGCLASLAVVRGSLPDKWPGLDPEMLRVAIETWATLGALLVALLMVSRIPYPHLTKQVLRGRRHFGHLIQVILAGCVIVLVPELALVAIFWVYALLFPARYALVRSLRAEARAVRAGADEPQPH